MAAQVERIAISLRISANAVSVMGLGAGLLAGYFYYHQSSPAFVVAAFIAMVTWHVFDGADGRIARSTGTTSPLGRIIDGICDHLVFAAVYIGFALYIINTGGGSMTWVLMGAAGLSHAIQAAAYEERRQIYQRRLKRVDRATVTDDLFVVEGNRPALAVVYDWMQRMASGGSRKLDAALLGLETRGVPRMAIDELVTQTAPLVRRWSILNSNNRTIMLAAFALAGQPILYFIYEIMILNLVFLALFITERSLEDKLAKHATDNYELG